VFKTPSSRQIYMERPSFPVVGYCGSRRMPVSQIISALPAVDQLNELVPLPRRVCPSWTETPPPRSPPYRCCCDEPPPRIPRMAASPSTGLGFVFFFQSGGSAAFAFAGFPAFPFLPVGALVFSPPLAACTQGGPHPRQKQVHWWPLFCPAVLPR